MVKVEVGKRIKKCRKDCHMTQDELAKKLNTSRQCISSWEKDRTQPDMDTLNKIAEILNCPVDYFVNISTGMSSYDIIIDNMQYLDNNAILRVMAYASELMLENEKMELTDDIKQEIWRNRK